MSTFEKISAVAIGVLLVVMLLFSYHEFTEHPEGKNNGPGFDQSLGQSLEIGPFTTVLNEDSSGGVESNCEELQPVLIAVLHDIKEHLEDQNAYPDDRDSFEVNQQALQLLCNKNADITLVDGAGNKLLLEKVPFVRAIPAGGTSADIGTDVRINATVILPGTVPPLQPTTYGEELIPDRLLDTATSSQM
ncbi:MAG TPA: hypothetical protein VMH91_00755 [Candidatus Paceibacterota bacterium]|nr:hypothetical protein [Candidatus Paceibacterota bacterium]